MIAVGGFNSAIDKFARIDRIAPGAIVRMRDVRALAGGKGLHVALTCGTLGESVSLVGLSDPATRVLFDRALQDVAGRFVGIDAGSGIRTCLAIRDDDGQTTELLEAGPDVTPAIAEALSASLLAEAATASCVVLSGSLPPGLDSNTYNRLIGRVPHAATALDASGDALASGLAAGPLVAKPNRQEAAQLAGRAIRTRDDAVWAARAIAERGARIVMLSLGAEGAVLHSAERTCVIQPPVVTARNTVGAGDCLLGGFVVGLARGWTIETCARYAVACGTAKVLHPGTGMLSASDVELVARSVTLVDV